MLFLIAAFTAVTSLGATEALASNPPLFDGNSPIDIRLSADWDKLLRDRQSKPKRHAAILTVNPETAASQSFDITVSLRGKSRRRKENCEFPPLLLNFKREQVADTLFDGQNKLKLVTHCTKLGRTRVTSDDRLHSEYLLYRIYNLITPNSYKVRPVSITYSYMTKRTSHNHVAFLIEHKSDLAKRTGGTLINKPTVGVNSLSKRPSSLAALFNYFAGNTDFNFTQGPKGDSCCHNAISMTKGDEIIPIPYDFDATGFVDPPYAKHTAGPRLRSITQRLYRGFCAHKDGLDFAKERFLTTKPAIDELLATYPEISGPRRKKLQRYSRQFFSTLTNPKQFERKIQRECR